MKLNFHATNTALFGLAACLFLGLATPAAAQQASACQDLASLKLDNAAITAELLPAGPFSSTRPGATVRS
jgi:hypothetical protein